MINQTRFFTTEKANIPTNIANGTINANDLVITSDTHELYFVDENNNYFPITTTKEELGIDNVTNDAQIKGKASGTTENHVLTWGVDGYTVKDSGYTINKSVPANAVFTDTTYVTATSSASGLMSAEDKAKLDGMDEATEGGSIGEITIVELDGTMYGGGTQLAGLVGTETRGSYLWSAQFSSTNSSNTSLGTLIGDKKIVSLYGKYGDGADSMLVSVNARTSGLSKSYDLLLDQDEQEIKNAKAYVVNALLNVDTQVSSLSQPFHLYAICI